MCVCVHVCAYVCVHVFVHVRLCVCVEWVDEKERKTEREGGIRNERDSCSQNSMTGTKQR